MFSLPFIEYIIQNISIRLCINCMSSSWKWWAYTLSGWFTFTLILMSNIPEAISRDKWKFKVGQCIQ